MATGSRGRVLVVEDDDSMREAIESLLDAAVVDSVMYASAEALLADGGSACAAACVVSDLKLPGMSGLELLRELRSRGTRPPVILITGHDSEAFRAEAARQGAVAYLAKPFLGSALLAAISNAITPSPGANP
jgi:two-component system response regulator FixJ